MTAVLTPARSASSTPVRITATRAPVLALVVFVATLPLEWVTVTGAAGGFIKPFHLAGLAVISVGLARWRPRQLIGPVLRQHAGVYVAYAVLLGAAFAGGLAYDDPFLSRTLIFRQVYYAGTSVVIAGVVALVVADAGRRSRMLAWSGLVALVVLLAGLGVSLARQSVNPITVVGDALRSGDPDLISYRLLRSAFRADTGLVDVAANLRHKVFGGLLVAVFLGLACRAMVERSRPVLRAVLGAAGVIGAALVVLSLSRSTIVCLAVVLALVALRMVMRNRLRPAQAVGVGLVAVLAVGMLVSPAGELLLARFTGSGSYESRLDAIGPLFLEEFEGAAAFGTTDVSVERSPHNLVLHSWLSGGIVAAVAALVMLVSLARVWLREARRYVGGRPGWVIPVGQVWMLGLGIIPFVRAFTAGNQFHMVEWAAVGFFLGLTMANDRAST
ncbi:MAG: O-antigen ligase family protein [Acidimicrobiales bacterium]